MSAPVKEALKRMQEKSAEQDNGIPAHVEELHLPEIMLPTVTKKRGTAHFIHSLPRVTNFKFPLQPNWKYYITQYEELRLSSLTVLRWEIIILPILTTSLIHLSLKRLG